MMIFSRGDAIHYLSGSDWDVQVAVNNFFAYGSVVPPSNFDEGAAVKMFDVYAEGFFLSFC